MVPIQIINDMAFMPSEHKLNSATIGSVVSIQMFNDIAFMPSVQGSVWGSLVPSQIYNVQFSIFDLQSSMFNLQCYGFPAF